MTLEPVARSGRRFGARWLVGYSAACAALTIVVLSSPAAAQTVINPVDHMAFDRPESWALAYFASAMLPSGLETPQTRTPGSVSLGLEFGWLPRLSAAQQLVGFNGTAPNDLNKAPLFLRPRVTIALPARLSVIVAAVPPVRSFGVTPKLFTLGLERPVYESPAWAAGLRVFGQVGTVQGAYTCPKSVLAFPSGSPGNPEGCQALSSDTATLRYAGGEASVAYRPGAPHGFSPHAAVGLTYMNLEFQVNALTGVIDHTKLLSHGTTVFGSAGISRPLTSRLTLGIDVFYSPLSVQRDTAASVQTDGLLNVRALVTYRLR